MTTFDQFRDRLREALPHLYDPSFLCPTLLAEVLNLPAEGPVRALRDRVRGAIERLAPEADFPLGTRAHRFHEILSLRYLRKLTQEQAAENLCITVRHLARQQSQAIDVLARLLWEQAAGTLGPPGATDAASVDNQVAKEVSLLTQQAPDRLVDVADALRQVLALTRVLAERHGIAIESAPEGDELRAMCHPSILQQALVVAISYLLRHMHGGRISITTFHEPGAVSLTLRADPCPAPPPGGDWVGHKLLSSQDGSVGFTQEGDALVVCLTLPSARRISVLVVDDNQDLVQFYRLCTAGTRYEIFSLGQGSGIFQRIDQLDPDVIVLDLMLPDIDGWELLTQLHEHPRSRDIPVVLCSVVQEEELALALGAHVVVSKPVRRQRFLQALDEALSRARGAG